MNRVTLVGRITKDLVSRRVGDSIACNFTVACTRTKEESDFINCVAWNKTCEILCQYSGKGKMIGVEGRIQTRSYDDKDGKKVYVTEVLADRIELLEPKKETRVEVPKVADANDKVKATYGDEWSKPQNDGLNVAAYGVDRHERRQPNPTIDDYIHGDNVIVNDGDLPF